MREQFERVFAKKKVPDEIEEYLYKPGDTVISVMTGAKMVSSNGAARRMIKQNAVSIVDADKITSAELVIDESYRGKILKVGKRKFIKLI